MDYVGYFLGGLALLGITVDGLLRKVEKHSRSFLGAERAART